MSGDDISAMRDGAASLADRLGLRRYPRSWRGLCPSCQYPGNTFSLRSVRGDRVNLHCFNGCDRAALDDAVRRAVAGAWMAAPGAANADTARHRKARQAAARRLWNGSESARGTLVELYLAGRGLPDLAASAALRFRGDTPHPEGGRYPALLAAVVNSADALVAVHRTYLGPDGRKAEVEPQKANLGPVWGGAIRLDPLDPDKPLVIGEGIETSASAGRLTGWPAWAAISAGNLERAMVLPPQARRVVIAADPDKSGERAACAAALRWKAEGREVRIARPTGTGDFNDLLQRRAAREPANAR